MNLHETCKVRIVVGGNFLSNNFGICSRKTFMKCFFFFFCKKYSKIISTGITDFIHLFQDGYDLIFPSLIGLTIQT